MNPREAINRGMAASRMQQNVRANNSVQRSFAATPAARTPTTRNLASHTAPIIRETGFRGGSSAPERHQQGPSFQSLFPPAPRPTYTPPAPKPTYHPPAPSHDLREQGFRDGARDPARYVPGPVLQTLDSPGPRPTQVVAPSPSPQTYSRSPSVTSYNPAPRIEHRYAPRPFYSYINPWYTPVPLHTNTVHVIHDDTVVVNSRGRWYSFNSETSACTLSTYLLGLLILPPVLFVAVAAPELFIPTVLILAPVGVVALLTMLAFKSICRDCLD